MFNCDEVIQLLTDYVDEELDPESRIGLERHFGACPACDRFLKSFRATIELTGTFRCEDIPDAVSDRLHDFLAEQLRRPEEGRPDKG